MAIYITVILHLPRTEQALFHFLGFFHNVDCLFHPNHTENSGKIALIEATVPRVQVKAGVLPGMKNPGASTKRDPQKF
jgi:hypothetical protein